MSYDLRFEGSPMPLGNVRTALAELLGSETMFWAEGDDWLNVDLWYADDEGTATEPPLAHAGLCNRADIHVNLGNWGVTWRLVHLAVRVADRITTLTNWRAFDPQRDEHLDGFDHPWRSEVSPAAQIVTSIDVAGGRVTLQTRPYVGTPTRWTWTLATGELVGMPHPAPPTSSAARESRSADGSLVARTGRKRIEISGGGAGRSVTIERCGDVRALAFSPSGALLASGADTPTVRIWTVDGKPHARLAAPGCPRVWEGIRGRLLPDAKESGRSVEALCFIDGAKLVAAFVDGRVCLYGLPNKTAFVSLALLDGGRWAAMTPDGAWDASPDVDVVQWSWNTDARAYRDATALAPSMRRTGLLATLLV